MIRVISLSPAIDTTYQVSEIHHGQSHRVTQVEHRPGGKGINVARILNAGGADVELVVALGGENGKWIRRSLGGEQLKLRSVDIAAETRRCVAVVDSSATVFNEPAAELTELEFEQVISVVSEPVETLVVSGSLPAGLSGLQVVRLFQTSRKASKNLIIDTSGANLLLACSVRPDLIKPNLEEALQATDTSSTEEAVKSLVAAGAKLVLLSKGEQGLTLFDDLAISGLLHPEKGNPTGAGDAVTALAARSLENDEPKSMLVANCVAAGTLAVLEPVAGEINWGRLLDFGAQVAISEEKWR